MNDRSRDLSSIPAPYLEADSHSTKKASGPLGTMAWLGILNGLAATLGYTLASACLRQAADDPPIWVSTVKAGCTAIIFLPLLVAIARRGRKILPPARDVWMLVFVSVFVQIFGNVFYQLSLDYIGLALAVPLTLGAMVLSSAILGRVIMNEPLTGRILIGLAMLILAIGILSRGAEKAVPAVDGANAASFEWLWGAITAVVSGFAYAVLGVAIRQSTRHDIPLATPIVFVSVIGTVVLGAMSLLLEGVGEIQTIRVGNWYAMIAAGVLNGVAFLALVKSLKILPVVYVNAINTLQMMATAFIGLAWFHEPWTGHHTLGLVLTAAGLLFLMYAANHHRQQNRPRAAAALGDADSSQS